ncbi:MAG: universal stress protein [Actinomycetota bacterium]|nr:universal stress protein [Actinomycetota bacterium]
MTSVVLAAIDECEAANTVLGAASGLARAFDATVEAFHVRALEHPPATGPARDAGVPIVVVDGDPATQILRALTDPAVTLGVIATRNSGRDDRLAGGTARRVLEQGLRPVVVVRPGMRPRRLHRALVPLDGTRASSAALTEPLRLLSATGMELCGLHVFEPDRVPNFWRESIHARKSTAAECSAIACRQPMLDLRLRSGDPIATTLAAATEDVDLLVLVWRRELDDPGAELVRAALRHSPVPVLLVPEGRRRRGEG